MKFRDLGWMRDEFTKALKVGEGPEATNVSTDATTLATWTDAASKRRPVLFVGAGWTLNDSNRDRAVNGSPITGKQALTWAQLSNLLRENLQPDVEPGDSVDPLWLAELYRQRHGAEALYRVVERAVPKSLQPGELHRILLKVRWHSILTTNYDTLLEQALGQFGEFSSCEEDSDLVLSQSSTALEVIHLHGIISRPETIVLAYEDYRQYAKNHPGFLARVRQLFLQHPVMFIGFGATDPNFLQWSGWLNDVVGDFKNPWISLTHTPPRGLALGRYWGTRLQFVTLPNPSNLGAFDEVVKSVFGVIRRVLDEDDTFDRTVVARRFLSCATVDAVFQTTHDLLAVGTIRGYAGSDWENSRKVILQCGASKLLDLARLPWRKARQDTETIPTIELIVHDPALAPHDLADDVEVALGQDIWRRWLELVRANVGSQCWDFWRVRLEEWYEDKWNWINVDLPSDKEPTAAIHANGHDDGPGPSSPISPVPKTPLDYRRSAFQAFEDGDWARSADLYAEAARLSREHGEPLRVRLLTLWSIRACLHGGYFAASHDNGRLRELLEATNETTHELEKQLRMLPPAEQLAQLNGRESDAHENLSKALLEEFFNPLGRQPSVHFGRPHVAATDWFEYFERNWFAPGVVHSAAKLLGLNQWFSGFHREALETLFRYGSAVPKQLLKSLAQRLNVDQVDLVPLLSVASSYHGSFGAQLSQIESLGDLVPWLTTEQLVDTRRAVVSLRQRLDASDGCLTRGTSRISPWQTHVALDEVEQATWCWMPIEEAFEALCAWIKLRSGRALAEDPAGRGLAGVSSFNWKGVRKSIALKERIVSIVRTFAQSAIAARQEAQRAGNMRAAAWFLIQLWNDELIHLDEDSEIGQLFEKMMDCLPHSEKSVLLAQKARLASDAHAIGGCIDQAIPTDGAEAQLKEFVALRVLVVLGEHCHERAAAVEELVQRLLSRIREEKAKQCDSPFAGFDKTEGEVGYLLASLISEWPESSATPLIDCAWALLEMYPPAAEHFTAIGAEKLGSLQAVVHRNVRTLLRGGLGESFGTARDQRFAGTRAVVRAISSQHQWILESDTAISLVVLTDSPAGPLAAYATWALAEWATKGVSAADDEVLRLVVVPALRRAARDRRLGVAVNGVRGLFVVSGARPDWVAATEVAEFKSDKRIAMQRVFDGLVPTSAFASVL